MTHTLLKECFKAPCLMSALTLHNTLLAPTDHDTEEGKAARC